MGNCCINLRHPFSGVTPEPGLQFHADLKAGLCHVLSTPSPEEHDLRLLCKTSLLGVTKPFLTQKNSLSEPF
jgi:hypothetical protein